MSLLFASLTLLGPHSGVAFLPQRKVASLEVAHSCHSHCSYASTRITSSYYARYHSTTLRHILSTWKYGNHYCYRFVFWCHPGVCSGCTLLRRLWRLISSCYNIAIHIFASLALDHLQCYWDLLLLAVVSLSILNSIMDINVWTRLPTNCNYGQSISSLYQDQSGHPPSKFQVMKGRNLVQGYSFCECPYTRVPLCIVHTSLYYSFTLFVWF